MTDLVASSVVHYYDTRTQRILCGVRGAEHRSTKHSRGVTCHDCAGGLAAQRARDAEAARTGANDAN